MIVVDSNVVAYYWVNGPLSEIAQRVQTKDSDWHVPILWRSEMRGILTGYLREGSLSAEQITRLMVSAEVVWCVHNFRPHSAVDFIERGPWKCEPGPTSRTLNCCNKFARLLPEMG